MHITDEDIKEAIAIGYKYYHLSPYNIVSEELLFDSIKRHGLDIYLREYSCGLDAELFNIIREGIRRRVIEKGVEAYERANDV